MATLGIAFNIVTAALDADQAALNITANNVTNANTPGYTLEVPTWQENDPVTINGVSYGQGASVTGAASQRNKILVQALQQQGQEASSSTARLSALEEVEGIFNASATSATDGTSSTSGLSQDLSSFFDSISALEASPDSNPLRQSVITAAQNLASDFQSASAQLTAQQNQLDLQSTSVVTQVNSLTQSIAQLNKEIQSTDPGQDAGTLEDQREEDVEQLSQLVGINQIQTENNGLTITTSSGALLVSEGQSYALSSGPLDGSTHIFDSQGNDITTSLASGGGELGGVLTVRDQDIPGIMSSLDTMAYDLATQVNAVNEAGSDANGNPGTAIFNISSTSSGAAASISVAITDPSQIAAAASGAGPGDDTNLLAMASLANQAVVDGTTPSDYLSDFFSSIGSLVSQVSTENTAQEASVSQLQEQVDSYSSVNLNDEASALETLEQSYQAASKIFTILDNVISSALNLGIQEGFSV
ncbi:flagellar hook-associated protein FlgK [Silvibacterium acidisoli]|uniref:flagellar hook-associated protein FlgK n=1 Tax=Acidobacteriaceae bacterium ZG23-2 TaxID=2883246 RepID=UPI00406D2747